MDHKQRRFYQIKEDKLSKQIVFIHGAWMTPRCWDKFVGYFSERGYECITPAWPYHEGTVKELNEHPNLELGKLGITQMVDHHAKIIEALPEPPIIVGHSFGGLFTQLLLDRGLGKAGVAVDPGPPRGVVPWQFSVTRSTYKIIAQPWKKLMELSFNDFRYAFVHTLSPEEQRKAYDDNYVPETSKILTQAVTALFNLKSPAKADYKNPKRPPLLLIAGAKDHIVPPTMVKANYNLQKKNPNLTEFHKFPDRTHWLIAQPGWEEVAARIEEFIQKVG